mmetsp:Transcript_15916/g.52440  ORF Transcript_15916/g.52440 Transcript_15916/m.52440 type:complete len:219 (-) Transcript_15916:976-1632(-)
MTPPAPPFARTSISLSSRSLPRWSKDSRLRVAMPSSSSAPPSAPTHSRTRRMSESSLAGERIASATAVCRLEPRWQAYPCSQEICATPSPNGAGPLRSNGSSPGRSTSTTSAPPGGTRDAASGRSEALLSRTVSFPPPDAEPTLDAEASATGSGSGTPASRRNSGKPARRITAEPRCCVASAERLSDELPTPARTVRGISAVAPRSESSAGRRASAVA